MNGKYFNDKYSSIDEFRATAEKVISIKILKRRYNSMKHAYREYSRNILQSYGLNIQEAIRKADDDGLYSEWDEERIKNAFNYGHGTMYDFKNYMNSNKRFCVYKKVRR